MSGIKVSDDVKFFVTGSMTNSAVNDTSVPPLDSRIAKQSLIYRQRSSLKKSGTILRTNLTDFNTKHIKKKATQFLLGNN